MIVKCAWQNHAGAGLWGILSFVSMASRWRLFAGAPPAPRLEVLLITSLNSKRWILPKGWLMEGLSAAGSAARGSL